MNSKALIITVVAAGALAIAGTVVVANNIGPTRIDPAKVEQACQAEFGDQGIDAVQRCQVRLLSESTVQSQRVLERSDEQRLDAARRQAGN